jgi:hypothetical protein
MNIHLYECNFMHFEQQPGPVQHDPSVCLGPHIGPTVGLQQLTTNNTSMRSLISTNEPFFFQAVA